MPRLDGHAVLVLTSAAADEHLVRAVQAGATSYLLKTALAEDVIAARRCAARPRRTRCSRSRLVNATSWG